MSAQKHLSLIILFSGFFLIFLVSTISFTSSYSYLNKAQQDKYEKLMDKKEKIMEKYNITEDGLEPKQYLDVIKEYGLNVKERSIFTDLLFLELQEEDTSICGNLGLEKFDDLRLCQLLQQLND